MRYRVVFIHGFTNRYVFWETTAKDSQRAIEKMYEQFGSNWDHQIVEVVEVKYE